MVSIITLREEPVPAQISAVDSGQTLAPVARGFSRGGTASPFEALMAQLTQATTGQGRGAAAAAAQVTSTGDVTTSNGQTTQETPIKTLEKSLRASGQPLENIQVASSDRGKLEQVLLQSGYRSEDVQQLLDRSANQDGSINLGALFANLTQYLPTQGPLLLLNPEDAPLLTQVLKDLGIDQGKIQDFMDNLPRQGDKLVVQGLPELLAQADPGQAKQVDQSVLGDLLTHLGLSQSDAQSLLTRATDNQGRTTATSVMALFSVAAQRQDQGLGQSLKDLASVLQVAKATGQGKASDADHLRAQVIQAVQKIEAQVSAQTQTLSQHWQEAFSEAQEALKAQGNGQALGQGQSQGLALGQGQSQGLALGQGQGLALGQGLGLPALLRQALGDQAGTWEFSPQLARAEGAAQAGSLGGHALAAAAELVAGGGGDTPQPARSQETAGAGLSNAKAAQPEASQSATSRPVERAQAGDGLGMFNQNLSQAEAAAGPRPVLPAYVVRQVGQQIVQMVSRQQDSLRLELKPPSLGEVNLELTVKDGVVKASVVTETAAAKQVLENGLDQLKQQLTMQGLKVESVEITVNPDAQRQQSQAQAQADFNQRRPGSGGGGGGGGTEAIEGLESLDTSLAAASGANGRINLFA